MNYNIKVSLIIPVYNASKYLRRCLDSCVHQTLEELEIILVNDCSPDQVDNDIMCEYESRYPGKVRCFWHDRNRGPGGARTTGVKAARGEYIAFSDADDYSELNKCEIMYNTAISENADMVCCNFDVESFGVRELFSELLLNEVTLENLATRKTTITHPGQNLICKKLMDDNNLYFADNFWSEDVVAFILLFFKAKKFVKIQESLYVMCLNITSVTAQISPKVFLDLPDVMIYLKKEALRLNIYNEFKDYIDAFCLNRTASFYRMIVLDSINPDVVEDFVRFVKMFEPKFDDNKYILPITIDLWNTLLPHLNDSNALCNAFMNWVNRVSVYSEVYAKIGQCVKSGKKIAIWGAGKWGRRIVKYLRIRGLEFEITDSNSQKYGTEFEPGLFIKPWSDLSDSTDVVVIAIKRGGDELAKQIEAQDKAVIRCDFSILQY